MQGSHLGPPHPVLTNIILYTLLFVLSAAARAGPKETVFFTGAHNTCHINRGDLAVAAEVAQCVDHLLVTLRWVNAFWTNDRENIKERSPHFLLCSSSLSEGHF